MTTTTRRRKATLSLEKRSKWTAARETRLAELHEQVAAGVEALAGSEAWRPVLDAAREFHRYSLGSQLLITVQRPDATQVAGFTTWKSLGRQVRGTPDAGRITTHDS